jgi:flagellar biosynthesis/type III secretory pathway M-ring protein FliF/YscJ
MGTVIILLAVFILLWLILKPFILLLIEKENDKYDKEK